MQAFWRAKWDKDTISHVLRTFGTAANGESRPNEARPLRAPRTFRSSLDQPFIVSSALLNVALGRMIALTFWRSGK
jgi:hypothetical protein